MIFIFQLCPAGITEIPEQDGWDFMSHIYHNLSENRGKKLFSVNKINYLTNCFRISLVANKNCCPKQFYLHLLFWCLILCCRFFMLLRFNRWWRENLWWLWRPRCHVCEAHLLRRPWIHCEKRTCFDIWNNQSHVKWARWG